MKRRRHKHISPIPAQGKGSPPAGEISETAALSRKRLWLFRLTAAVLSPLLFFVLLELGLRLLGCGYPTPFLLLARSGNRHVSVQNDRFTWRFLGPRMARPPLPLAIPEAKPPNTVRIFVLGESAALGDPQPEFGLARMLTALLEGKYPQLRFEVVNTGIVAINSHAILPIARDCARQRGDLWVIYMGNNEVVGPFGSGTVFGPRAPSLALVRASLAVKATRTGQLLESWLDRLQHRPAERSEWSGMQMFLQHQVRQDDPRMERVYGSFERNLEDILAVGLGSGAKIVVSSVASNLKDCAPFASQHYPGLSPAQRAEWEALYRKGAVAEQAGLGTEAIDCFRQADKIDDSFAEMHFRWGRCCLALGEEDEARKHFQIARDQDTLRFRCDTRLNEIIRHAAFGKEQQGIRFADAEQALMRESPHGLTGREFLYEHVHLTFEGNYLLARTVAQEVAGFLPAASDPNRPWPSAQECARRLAWNDWTRYKAVKTMYGRLGDPPFTGQLNHTEQAEGLRQQVEQLLPAAGPAALRQAEQGCRDAVAAAPDDWVLQADLALLRQAAGDIPGAIEAARRVLDLLPNYSEGWRSLGQLLAMNNRFDDATAALRQALLLTPQSTAAMTDLAQVLARQGRTDEAVARFKQALIIKPDWSPAHLGLAKIFERAAKRAEAESHFRAALQNPVNTPEALTTLAMGCFDKGLYNEAVTNFLAALQLDPADARTHLNLAVTCSVLKRSAEAKEHYAEAVRLNPTLAQARVGLGIELGRQGDDDGAIRQFEEAVRLKPDFLQARFNFASALLKVNRRAEALAQVQEVLRHDPTNVAALNFARQLGAR